MEYVFSTKRIEGLPDWAKTERYDVIAEIDPKDCCRWTNETTQEKSLAVQGFLQEKLKLKWHKETRMVGGFDLVVGKKGPKFAPAKTDAKLPDWSDEAIHSGRYLPQLNGIPITMEELAALLSATAEVGHPVVDKTGLAGRYTLYIQYQPPQVNDSRIMEADGTPVQSHALTIFDDLEVLGLELKGTKVPVDVLVIDKIERPSEN